MHAIDKSRRRCFQWLGAASGLMILPRTHAHHTDTHFEDRSEHQIVYQCNKADPDYLEHILFSVGELIRKYGDNVEIVVAWAAGSSDGLTAISVGAATCAGPAAAAVRPAVASATSRASSRPQRREPVTRP